MDIKVTDKDIERGCRPLNHEFCNEIGFTQDKFNGYLWLDGNTVIISLICSLNPGKGNFKALLGTLKSKGYSIIVPYCSTRMYNILLKAGFTGTSKEMRYNNVITE